MTTQTHKYQRSSSLSINHHTCLLLWHIKASKLSICKMSKPTILYLKTHVTNHIKWMTTQIHKYQRSSSLSINHHTCLLLWHIKSQQYDNLTSDILITNAMEHRHFEQLTSSQLVKKFHAFYGTKRSITALTEGHRLSIFSATEIQSLLPHPNF